MNPPPNREVALFSAALELPASQRGAYLAEACADDPALCLRLEALLRVHEEAIPFLESPAPGAQESPMGAQVNGPTVRLSTPLAEKAGDRIGRYKLLQQIGEGGCGVVYMAEQEEPVRRRVALKVIKLGMDTKQVIARFEAERQALALMDHPNIAKVFDAGATDTGRLFFVMELVRGIKITEYCDQNNLSTEDRLKLFTQVCQAIQHAHQKGIIHRDIKPSNVLVTVSEPGAPGCPKVIDFGIAKVTTGQRLTDKTVFTAFEQFIGTPVYMSPEQAMMTSLDIDTRTDIYALGVLLYELLTGQTPFDAKDLMAAGLDAMRRTICEQEPVRPSTRLTQELVAADVRRLKSSTTGGPLSEEEIRASSRRLLQVKELVHLLRGDLDWIVMKALEKDRTRRYETANGLARDVERHLADEPVVARPPSKLYRFQKLARRNKLAFAAATAIAAVLAIGAVVSTWQAIRATRATREQTRLRQVAETKGKKSEQVAQFLQDMLKGVGPSVALGRDTILLQEILHKTAERIRKDLTNQPEVEVELGLTLADTYRDLALYEQMEGVARHSLQLARARLGEENESVAKSLISLGYALKILGQMHLGVIRYQKLEESEKYRRLHDGNLLEAEKYCHEGLAMSRKLLGNEDPTVAYGLYQLANVLASQYRMAEAESMHREALAIYQKRFGNEHPQVAKVLSELSSFLAHQNKSLAEAEKLSRQALVIQRKLLGNNHPEIARSLFILAIVSSLQGRWPQGEASFREVVEIWRKLQAEERPEFADALHNLGYLLMQQGKLAEAETTFRDALALRRKLFGNEHLDVAESMHKLAITVAQQGRPREAENIAREELAMQRKLRTNDCVELDEAVYNLGYMLMQQSKPAEAETMFRESLAMRRRLFGNEHQQVADSLHKVAIMVFRQGRVAEAVTFCREELATQRKLRTNDCLELASALNSLGYLLMQQNELVEAETRLREAVAMHGRIPGNENGERWLSWNNLAKVFQLEGKLAEAETTHLEALAVKRKLLGTESAYVVDSLNLLADLLQQQGRRAEARPLAEEAVAIFLRHPDQAEFLPLAQPLRHVLTVLGNTAAVDALNAQLGQRFHKNAESEDAEALNDLAWFLAVCPDAKFRDGTNAVACGEKAVAATDRKNLSYLDTLAAAYAEAGQFAKAISITKEALALPHSEGDESDLTSRLKLYESNSPYREAD